MARFHINDNGDAKQCSAKEGNCPFGADAPHFSTKKKHKLLMSKLSRTVLKNLNLSRKQLFIV